MAAGMGSRLKSISKRLPKCLIEVKGISLLDRLVHSLQEFGIERLIIVLGHKGQSIRDHLGNKNNHVKIEYIENPAYETTNNIYSLWWAMKEINEPFLLLEADLIFESSLLLSLRQSDQMAVSHRLAWMKGSTVTLAPYQKVSALQVGHNEELVHSHKTVNIYNFSLLSCQKIAKRLDSHISAGKTSGYYETVFSELIDEGSLNLEAVFFDKKNWYEIDTLEDHQAAEKIFSDTPTHSSATKMSATCPS